MLDATDHDLPENRDPHTACREGPRKEPLKEQRPEAMRPWEGYDVDTLVGLDA